MINFEDFIRQEEPPQPATEEIKEEEHKEEEVVIDESVDLEIQKVVVDALAAEKAAQEEEIKKLKEEIDGLKTEVKSVREELERVKTEKNGLEAQIDRVAEALLKNSEKEFSNQVTLIERNEVMEDRFEGETRDHVIEALRDARDRAEQDGRLRCAQLLESVLAANEPVGELAKRRVSLEKIFDDNMNVINGQVINELDKLDIRYKDGETYLLAKEIIKRSY